MHKKRFKILIIKSVVKRFHWLSSLPPTHSPYNRTNWAQTTLFAIFHSLISAQDSHYVHIYQTPVIHTNTQHLACLSLYPPKN